MTIEPAGTTLREQLSESFDTVMAETPAADTPAAKPVAAPEVKAETPEERAGRTAGRARDESGRLLPGKPAKPEAKPAAADSKADTPSADATGQAKPAAAAPAVRARPAYPSTWKKDYQGKWESVDPDVAEEIARREADYAKGVSTYKAEYDNVKPLAEAIKPYAPFIQHAGLKPEEFVQRLAKSDQTLRFGQPEEKLRTFARLAQDYQIPLHQLLIQGEDGKVYLNQQYFEQQAQQQSQGITAQDIERIVTQRMQAAQIQNAVQGFIGAKDASGNPLYPHFETVKATMDGILRAGLASDLPSAYNAALRMPQHSELFDAMQKQQREAEQQKEAKAKAEVAARARANTVSSRSQPTPGVSQSANGRKSLRDTIAESFDAAESGRV